MPQPCISSAKSPLCKSTKTSRTVVTVPGWCPCEDHVTMFIATVSSLREQFRCLHLRNKEKDWCAFFWSYLADMLAHLASVAVYLLCWALSNVMIRRMDQDVGGMRSCTLVRCKFRRFCPCERGAVLWAVIGLGSVLPLLLGSLRHKKVFTALWTELLHFNEPKLSFTSSVRVESRSLSISSF